MARLITSLIRKSRELRKNASMTRAELEAFKLQKFRSLVQYIEPRSSLYAGIIRERNIDPAACVPADFPVLTKEVFVDNFDAIVTDRRITKRVVKDFLSRSTDPNNLLFDEYHVLHTSGSSGQIGYFVFSERDWAAGIAQQARAAQSRQRSMRHGFGKLRLAYFGAIGGHFGGVSIVRMLNRGLLRHFVSLSLNDVNDPLPNVIARLNAFQPNTLVGYTTALKILAAKQVAGELDIAPVFLSTGGEPQSEADRELFKKTWGCEVSNGYGSSEHMVMGLSRSDGKTMVLYDDDIIYEFHSDHLITTNLFNCTLPLIRYRMSDVIRSVEQDTSAGPYVVVESLLGRSELVPTFVARDGTDDFISPHTINEIFIPQVNRFQMRLIDRSRFNFAVCLEDGLQEGERAEAVVTTRRKLQNILDQKGMDRVTFEVVVMDDLPVNEKTGKFQLIVAETASA